MGVRLSAFDSRAFRRALRVILTVLDVRPSENGTYIPLMYEQITRLFDKKREQTSKQEARR